MTRKLASQPGTCPSRGDWCVKWLTCAVLSLPLVAPMPASASFPGRNGDLAVSSPFGGSRHIVEIDVRTGDKDWLTQPRGLSLHRETFAPEYFPDGQRFLFVRVDNAENKAALWSSAREGGDSIMHTPEIRMDQAGPSLSPDGTRVAYSRFGGVFTAKLDGSDERELRPERRCTRPDGSVDAAECDQRVSAPVWSPDGRWMAVSAGGLWLMDASDGRLVRRVAAEGRDVDWSPDSRRLAFAHPGVGQTTAYDISSVRIDGTGLRRLTRGRDTTDMAPAWSPDGRWLAWVRARWGRNPLEYDGPVHLSVWRKRITGGGAERIAGLPQPNVEGGEFVEPTLSWQARPRR